MCSVSTVMASELASQFKNNLSSLLACDILVDSLVLFIGCYSSLVTASIYRITGVKIVKFNVLQFKAKSAIYPPVIHCTITTTSPINHTNIYKAE